MQRSISSSYLAFLILSLFFNLYSYCYYRIPPFHRKSVFYLSSFFAWIFLFTYLWVVHSASSIEFLHPVILTAARVFKTTDVTPLIKTLQWFLIRYRLKLQKCQCDVHILCSPPTAVSYPGLSLSTLKLREKNMFNSCSLSYNRMVVVGNHSNLWVQGKVDDRQTGKESRSCLPPHCQLLIWPIVWLHFYTLPVGATIKCTLYFHLKNILN